MRTLILLSLGVVTGCAHPVRPVVDSAPHGQADQGPRMSQPAAATVAVPALPVRSVAVMPIHAKGRADRATMDVLDDLLLSSLQNLAGDRLRVVGKSDIDALLGFEKAKDTLGCDDVSCAAEIAGALGVDSILSVTAGTLGGKYVLTLVWIDQKQAAVFRRHSETLGDDERTFDRGVASAVAKLLGVAPPPSVEPPLAPIGNPARLTSWLQGGGTWYERDGAIFGAGGHLFFREELGDYRFAATAEIVSGHAAPGVVCYISRAAAPGAKEQGYLTNLMFAARKLNVFRALNGVWQLANPAWQTWTAIDGIDPQVNRVVWESVGPRHRVTLNGALLYEFVDGATPRGRPGFCVESPSVMVRFSDIELQRL